MAIAIDWQALRQRFLPALAPQEPHEDPYEALVELAHREMEAARSQFVEVRDPDLVDHAIYRLRAAERHYVFLLRQVREARETSSQEARRIDSTQR